MNQSLPPLRLGTRGSKLALVQANMVLELLKKQFPDDAAIQGANLVTITTTGDRIKDRPLSEIGGKGFFAKEIEQALLANEVDFAVHCLKDMETKAPDGLMLAAILQREDARDALLSNKAQSLEALPPNSVVGTCAPRRVALILHHRPDLICVPLRGNVDSRIQKLRDGDMDAIILALAGLRRLGRQDEATYIFPESEMLPAVGQGALTLQCRKDDPRTLSYLTPLNHLNTQRCVTAERALLAGLGGSCRTPIGGHTTLQDDGQLQLDAMIASPSGAPLFRTKQIGNDPTELGLSTAKILKELAGADLEMLECAS
jgi:hydroxymethylbilane synthase